MGIETAILAGIGGSGLLGNFFGNKKSARTQTSDSKTTSQYDNKTGSDFDTTYGSSTTPTEPGQYGPLGDRLLDTLYGNINRPVSLEGYEATGLSNINKNARLGQQSLDNKLGSRGLYGSPVAGASTAGLEAQRLSDTSQFQNSLPLLERFYQNQDTDRAADFYARRPLGTTTSGTSAGSSTGTSSGTGSGTSASTTVYPGSAAGAVFGGLSDYLAQLLGMGAFGGGKSGGGGGGYYFGGDYIGE